MITLLLVPQDERWRARIKAVLPEASLFEATDEVHALHQLRRIGIDIVLWAGEAARPSGDFLRVARDNAPACVTVAVRRGDDEASEADYTLSDDDSPHQVETVVRRAVQRLALVREIQELRMKRIEGRTQVEAAEAVLSLAPARLPREFTRILAAGFDLPRTLETFMDAVVELLRPARA